MILYIAGAQLLDSFLWEMQGQMNVELKDLLESEKSLRENVDAYEEDFRKLQHTTGAQTSDEIIRVRRLLHSRNLIST